MRTSAFQTSLHCLAHPFTLASIAILIVNDHILKTAIPSWLTGKLSDFVGLFFFPFLVAIFLAPVSARTKLSLRAVRAIAFSITAIWFVLIKATNWGNALTIEIVSAILGFQIQIVRDQSDLIALSALLPAWMLWNRTSNESAREPTGVAWLAFVIAALATMATSPPPLPPRVVRVAADGSRIYARIKSDYSPGAASSADGGKTWQSTRDYPPVLDTDPPLPATVCRSNALNCFRIGNGEAIEQSRDGGTTWQIAFSVSARKDYMARAIGGRGLFGFSKSIDFVPLDLTIGNFDGADIVVVGMGTEGVIIRDQNEDWHRVRVLGATPTPLATNNLSESLDILLPESDLWISGALTLMFSLTVLAASSFEIQSRDQVATISSMRRLRKWMIGGTILLVIISILWTLLGITTISLIRTSILLPYEIVSSFLSGNLRNMIPIWWIGLPWYFVGLLTYTLLGLTICLWWLMARESPTPQRIYLAAGLTLLTALGIFPVGFVPLILWTMNAISAYNIAFLLAIGISTALSFACISSIRRVIRSTVAEPKNSSAGAS